MTTPTDRDMELADEIDDLVEDIRAQNWKNGGVHTLDLPEAKEMVAKFIASALARVREEAIEKCVKTANEQPVLLGDQNQMRRRIVKSIRALKDTPK